MQIEQSWIDRVARHVAPRWQLKRLRARVTHDLALRNYEGAAGGRRTQGWRRTSTDVTQATGPHLGRLRDIARDLVRNNPYAESALATICDHTVGWGIVAEPTPANRRAAERWDAWANTTACDADGRHDFAGLQKLIMRTVAESGEVLVRRRMRRPEDGLPIAMQIQVLEPDFLDTSRDTLGLNGGLNRIVQGVEFDALGKRVAYWLYPEHPGSAFATVPSVRVAAANVLHIFKGQRAGQVRGVTWFAGVLLRFKDFDEFEDATLMKQKIAACLAVFVTDVDGTAAPLGTTDTTQDPQIDSLEPGMIRNLSVGQTVTTVDPPTVRDYSDYTKTSLRAIATGIGVTYEDLTGDYSDMPFSAARMSRLRHWARIEDWRWRMLIPQFCDPVFQWAMELAAIGQNGVPGFELPVTAEWTAPPAPMIDPVNEGLAYQRNIRASIMSLSEALRERGYNPKTVLKEIAADNALLDALGIISDSDARNMTQAGQLQGEAAAAAKALTAPDEMEEAARRLRLAGGGRR